VETPESGLGHTEKPVNTKFISRFIVPKLHTVTNLRFFEITLLLFAQFRKEKAWEHPTLRNPARQLQELVHLNGNL
jgi:hypothetical protein